MYTSFVSYIKINCFDRNEGAVIIMDMITRCIDRAIFLITKLSQKLDKIIRLTSIIITTYIVYCRIISCH